MHVWVKLHWSDSPKLTRINEHRCDQRSEVCKDLLVNPTHRFKQPEILENIASQKTSTQVSSNTVEQRTSTGVHGEP